MIKVVCPNIKPIVKNNTFCKEIAKMPLISESEGFYVHKTLKSVEHYELEDSDLDFLEIQLLDESDELIRLDIGPPTFVKVHLSSMNMNDINIKVTSHSNNIFETNTASKFNSKLAQKMSLHDNTWKMNLSSIMFWNNFKLSSDFDFNFYIFDHVQNTSYHYSVPNTYTTHDKIFEYVKEKLAAYAIIWLSDENKVQLVPKSKFTLQIGKDLSLLLGCTRERKLWNTELHAIGIKISFHFPRNSFSLMPTHMFLYCNIIKSSLVGGGFHKLLKVIPIEQDFYSSYKIIEFENPEFLELSTSEIYQIDFELRTPSGSLIEFKEQNAETFLNLTLKRM